MLKHPAPNTYRICHTCLVKSRTMAEDLQDNVQSAIRQNLAADALKLQALKDSGNQNYQTESLTSGITGFSGIFYVD